MRPITCGPLSANLRRPIKPTHALAHAHALNKIRDRKNRISNREISGVFTGMGAEVEKNLTPGYQTGAKFDKNTWKAQTLFDAQRVKYKVAQTAEPLSRNRFLIIHSSCLLRIY